MRHFRQKSAFANPLFSARYALFQVPYPVSPVFATLTKTAGCVPTIPILELAASLPSTSSTLRLYGLSDSYISVQKVPHPGEHHGQTETVRRRDHVCVAHRAARLDHCGRSGPGRFLHAIGKWEERIGSHHASRERRLR